MNKRTGSGMVELILVMILLVLFGLSTFTLVVSGSDAYKATVKEKDILSDLRIATSYLDNKIKQNDWVNSVDIRKNPLSGEDSLVIKEKAGDKIFETWIYENEGSLKEVYIQEGQPFTDDMSFEICKVNALQMEQKGDLFQIQLEKGSQDKVAKETLIVNLHSGQ